MANRSSGNPQKSKHSRNARTSPQNPKQRVKRFKQLGASYPKRRMQSDPRNRKRQEEQRIMYAYAFSLLTASLLWWLQVPNQVVYALLIISIFIILLYLIPPKSRYTEFVNRCLLLMIVTFFITVLYLDWGDVLQILAHFFPIASK